MISKRYSERAYNALANIRYFCLQKANTQGIIYLEDLTREELAYLYKLDRTYPFPYFIKGKTCWRRRKEYRIFQIAMSRHFHQLSETDKAFYYAHTKNWKEQIPLTAITSVKDIKELSISMIATEIPETFSNTRIGKLLGLSATGVTKFFQKSSIIDIKRRYLRGNTIYSSKKEANAMLKSIRHEMGQQNLKYPNHTQARPYAFQVKRVPKGYEIVRQTTNKRTFKENIKKVELKSLARFGFKKLLKKDIRLLRTYNKFDPRINSVDSHLGSKDMVVFSKLISHIYKPIRKGIRKGKNKIITEHIVLFNNTYNSNEMSCLDGVFDEYEVPIRGSHKTISIQPISTGVRMTPPN